MLEDKVCYTLGPSGQTGRMFLSPSIKRIHNILEMSQVSQVTLALTVTAQLYMKYTCAKARIMHLSFRPFNMHVTSG